MIATSKISASALTEKQVQDARILYERMKKVDYSSIIETAMRECGVKKAYRANELLDSFLQWFSLIPTTTPDQPMQMLRSVDRMWHAFVLNTAFYRNFCNEFNSGKFVDHDPLDVNGNSASQKQQYAEHTLARLHQTFGTYVTKDLANLSEKTTCCVGC